jgi:hypothetical protein
MVEVAAQKHGDKTIVWACEVESVLDESLR